MTNSDILKAVSDGVDKAKAGKALEVFEQTRPFHDNGSLPAKSHYAFGWIIYYALHQSPDHDIAGRKQLLARYLRLNVPRPHKLHSMVLTEAIRLFHDSREAAFTRRERGMAPERFSIVRFAALWDLANLRPGDWRRKEFEGKMMGSTVEKFITLYVDELENDRTAAASEAFLAVMTQALTEYADSFNLKAQRASLHVLAGEHEAAAGLLRSALVAAPGKFFLWGRLASLVDPKENARLHIALLYKALTAPGPDQFKGRIRLSLAQALIAKKAFSQALWELQRVETVYKSNEWHLPPAWRAASDAIPEGTEASDPTPLYRKVEYLADNEIYSSLPAVAVRKTYHKAPRPEENSRFGRRMSPTAWRVTDDSGRNYWLQPHRFRIDGNLPVGTRLTIRLQGDRPVAAVLDE